MNILTLKHTAVSRKKNLYFSLQLLGKAPKFMKIPLPKLSPLQSSPSLALPLKQQKNFNQTQPFVLARFTTQKLTHALEFSQLRSPLVILRSSKFIVLLQINILLAPQKKAVHPAFNFLENLETRGEILHCCRELSSQSAAALFSSPKSSTRLAPSLLLCVHTATEPTRTLSVPLQTFAELWAVYIYRQSHGVDLEASPVSLGSERSSRD